MSNKLKKEIKNKWVSVDGLIYINGRITPSKINCIISNDKIGKSITIGVGQIMYEIPFEKIEDYLR